MLKKPWAHRARSQRNKEELLQYQQFVLGERIQRKLTTARSSWSKDPSVLEPGVLNPICLEPGVLNQYHLKPSVLEPVSPETIIPSASSPEASIP